MTTQATTSPWKDSVAVQFATGFTFIAVLLWWMFTGDIPFLSRVMFSPPSSEDVKSIDIMGVVGPMLFQALVLVGVNVIAVQTRIWSVVVGLIRGVREVKPAVESRPSEQAPSPMATTLADETRAAVIALGQAAADGASTQEIMRLADVIRKPIAIEELAKAYRDDDRERIDLLQRELARMVAEDVKPAPVKKAGGK